MDSIFYFCYAYARKHKKEVRTYFLSITLCLFCMTFIMMYKATSYQDTVTKNSYYSGDHHLLVENNFKLPSYIDEDEVTKVEIGLKGSMFYEEEQAVELYALKDVCDNKPLAKLQGRMPKHQDELCINEQYAGDYAKQIGDEIYLTNQNGEKERYVICGIYDQLSSVLSFEQFRQVFFTFDTNIDTQYQYIWIQNLDAPTAALLSQDYGLSCNVSKLSDIQIVSNSLSIKLLKIGFIVSVVLIYIMLVFVTIIDYEKKKRYMKQLTQIGTSKRWIYLFLCFSTISINLLSFLIAMLLSYLCVLFIYHYVVVESVKYLMMLISMIVLISIVYIVLMNVKNKTFEYCYNEKDDKRDIIVLMSKRINQKYRLSHFISFIMPCICITYFIVNTSIVYPMFERENIETDYVVIRSNYQDKHTTLTTDLELIEQFSQFDTLRQHQISIHLSLSNASIINQRIDGMENPLLSISIVRNSDMALSDEVAYFQNYYDIVLQDGTIQSHQMYDINKELTFKASQYVETNGQYEFESKSWTIPVASQEEVDMYFERDQCEEVNKSTSFFSCNLYVTEKFYMDYLYNDVFVNTPYQWFVTLHGDEEKILNQVQEIRKNYPGFIRDINNGSALLQKEQSFERMEQMYFKMYFVISLMLMGTMFVLLSQISKLRTYQNINTYKQLNMLGWTKNDKVHYVLYEHCLLLVKVIMMSVVLMIVANLLILVPLKYQLRIEMMITVLFIYFLYKLYEILYSYLKL